MPAKKELTAQEIAAKIGIKPPKVLKTKEVAILLGVTPRTVNAMVCNGTLPIGCGYDKNADGSCGGSTRTVVIEERLIKWLGGCDLGNMPKAE